jgi:hypothetical protein
MAKAKAKAMAKDGAPAAGTPRKVEWDDKDLTTSYANVCNVASTREEVTLLFGTNETGMSKEEMSVRLTERIILSPFAAKRLAQVIGNVMAEYEKRFGKLET